MQNKPNFRKARMNVTVYSDKDYENISNWKLGENKPNTNPIKPNLSRRSPLATAKSCTKPGWRSRIKPNLCNP